MREIINLGKIPSKEKFNYKKTLQLLLKCTNDEKLPELKREHELVVRRIESYMDLSSRIPNYKSTEWKYMIDDNCNFWIMRNEYIERNFIIKEKEGK